MSITKAGNNRGVCGGMRFLLPIGGLLLLAATLSGCGPTGTITYTGFPLKKNKGFSAAAENGVLTSVQAVVVPPDSEHCSNGGVKLVNTSNTSESPVYVCSAENKRIYEITNADVSALPATGALVPCSSDAETGCVASGNFKVVDSTQFDATKIAVGTTIAGTAGSLANCAADGATGCVATASYKAADMAAFDAWSIVRGKSIAGVAGSAYVGSLLASGAHRDQTSPQMTYAQEVAYGAAIWRTLNSGAGIGYREVPLIAKDDDGYTPSVNPVVKLTRPTVGNWGGITTDMRKVCGTAVTSVANKIINCETHNANATPWNGGANGISGEGSWTLVTVYSASLAEGIQCDTSCYEVWRDDRTGLLWSDKLADTVGGNTDYSWCKATGSNFSSDTGNPYREDDPSNYCDSATYQNQTQSPAPVSLCFEDSAWLSTPTAADPMKGNMHKHSGSATVKWRLPTKQDFEIAEHNGIRHVLPNMAFWFWSASVYTRDRIYAWLYVGSYGYVGFYFRDSATAVRCVGVE